LDIVVCLKQVPDTASKIDVKDNRIVEEGLTWVVNPYDEYAVEEAIRIKEKLGGKVTLLAIGPERAKEALKDQLAHGADEAIHIVDPAFDGSDAYATAKILAKAIAKVGHYDLIFAGWKGVDQDAGQVPIILAEMLGLPHLSFVTKFEISADGKSAKGEHEIEGGREVLECPLPAVVTAQKGLNEPRYASLKLIMAVKKKIIPEWKLADLGLDASEVGTPGALIETVGLTLPPPRKAGRIIPGDAPTAAKEVVRLLREEAKVV
jgi:electron transfer flavoprotein beta subunit